jgi:hypothetical protein
MNRFVNWVGFEVFCLLIVGQVTLAQPEVKPDELSKLKQERLEAAEVWLKSAQTDKWGGGGTDTHLFREVLQAIRAKRDSMLNLATTKKQRVEARKEAFDHLENVHKKIDVLFQAHAKGGEAVHFYSSKYEMLDAKIKWLEESQRE